MSFSTKDVRDKLTDKFGFERDRQHAKDHEWYVLELTGVESVRTKFSHSRPEIAGKLESMMSRQLRVSTPYFREMIRCAKSNEEYIAKLTFDPRIIP